MRAHRRFPRPALAGIAAYILLATATAGGVTVREDVLGQTAQRSAAAGFAITLWMLHVDALYSHCAKLGSRSDAQFLDAFHGWQDRNMPYVKAAIEYMADIEDLVLATQGEAAQKRFRAERVADSVASGHKAEATWFPDGRVDEASCRRMAALTANGSLDLDQSVEFFPILRTLKAEADYKAATR